VLRFVQIFARLDTWFGPKEFCSAEIKRKCLGEYNAELLDPAEPFFYGFLLFCVSLGALIDLLSLKWRWLTKIYLYLEMAT